MFRQTFQNTFQTPFPTEGAAANPCDIPTDSLPGERTVGDEFTHISDCVIEYTITTLNSGGTIRVDFRRQDVDNLLMVDILSSGTMRLFKRVGGGFTSLGQSASAVSGGDTIFITCDDEIIKVYVNSVLKITSPSVANFKTETDGLLQSEGTGGSVSDIVSWPLCHEF